MLLSIDTSTLRNIFDDETALKMIKEAGFDAVDYSMFYATDERDMLDDNYVEKAYKIKELLNKYGLVCNQSHAPFSFGLSNKMDLSDYEYLRIVRSIEFASIINAKNIVVHAIKNNIPKDFDFEDYQLKFYNSLVPFCEKFNINISVENLAGRLIGTGERFPVFIDPIVHNEFVKKLNNEHFNICLDLGHSAYMGYNPEDVIMGLDSNLLKIVHIHDNDFKSDSHLLPYQGNINWDAVTTAFAKSGYNGDISFELEGFIKKLDKDLIPVALKYAVSVGRFLISKIEAERNH